MKTHKHSAAEPHHGLDKQRREFLEKTLAGTGLLLLSLAPDGHGQGKRGGGESPRNGAAAAKMAAAAETFVKALNADQRGKATFTFEDDQRQDWHFVPKARKGIPYKELDESQRRLGNALLAAGMSERGLGKANTVISLELILREIEQNPQRRDPELYYFSVFGQPGGRQPWGWSFEGHHLSLNFAMANGRPIASTPAFFGANPAEVRHGARKGLRALPAEESLARALLKALDDRQRAEAVVSEKAPQDILSTNSRRAQPVQPAGVAASKLSQQQQQMLMTLLQEYAGNVAPELAAARLAKVRAAGLGNVHFAWAGSPEPGQAHYYRVQGPSFLVEYDNVQNDANHIHSVWRDFNGDFGLDLLGEHYEKSHHHS